MTEVQDLRMAKAMIHVGNLAPGDTVWIDVNNLDPYVESLLAAGFLVLV